MSSETLENEKPQGEEEVQAEENHTEQEDTPVKNDVNENGDGKEKDRVEEEKNEEEEEETDERGEAKSIKSTEESGYATPTSKRPTRERKTVDRYTVSSPDKFHQSSSRKTSSIEKVLAEIYGLLICMFYFSSFSRVHVVVFLLCRINIISVGFDRVSESPWLSGQRYAAQGHSKW